MQHLYIEIPGGDHSLFMSRSPNIVGHLFSCFNLVAKTHRSESDQQDCDVMVDPSNRVGER